MRTSLYKRYENKEAIGTLPLTDVACILVFDPDENDKYDCDLVTALENSGVRSGFHKHKIFYTSSGRAYIRKGQQRVYLDEVIRV